MLQLIYYQHSMMIEHLAHYYCTQTKCHVQSKYYMTFYINFNLHVFSPIFSGSHAMIIILILLFVGTGLGPVVFMYSPEDKPMDAPSDETKG